MLRFLIGRSVAVRKILGSYVLKSAFKSSVLDFLANGTASWSFCAHMANRLHGEVYGGGYTKRLLWNNTGDGLDAL